MSGTQDSNSALVQHRILSDVLPTTEVELPLPYNLNLKWTEATLNTPGQELDREHTQETPTVSLVPTVCVYSFPFINEENERSADHIRSHQNHWRT